MNNNSNTNNKEEKKEKKEKLYKYRGIENFRFFLDILVNNRLYASDFESMNDPMEGVYYSGKKIQAQMYENKKKLNFCSLSKKHNIGSMWCHYANDYKGVVFEVKIDAEKYDIREIEYISREKSRYIESISVEEGEDLVKKAKDILSKKSSSWGYEQEVRVFNEKDKYIEVEISNIFIGHKMKKEDRDFIEDIVRSIKPNIDVIPMYRNSYS